MTDNGDKKRDKQRSTIQYNTQKTKVARTPLKTRGELSAPEGLAVIAELSAPEGQAVIAELSAPEGWAVIAELSAPEG